MLNQNRLSPLSKVNSWTMTSSDQSVHRGIGLNFCWESRAEDDSAHFRALHEHRRFNYATQIPRLAQLGVNFVRVWMCYWNLPLDYPKPANSTRYKAAPQGERFNADGLAALKDLVALCEAHQVRLMLCIEAHINFMGTGWDLSPYNSVNGGPANSPLEFFTLEACHEMYRLKLKTLVDAVGLSPAVGFWEFFNEIDNLTFADSFGGPADHPAVTDWHRSMAKYLASIDPLKRPITTSVSHREIPGLWDAPEFAINQHHIYCNTLGIPEAIETTSQRTGTPHVIGEFGLHWDWSHNFANMEPAFSRDFLNGIWLGLFSPTPIIPLTWWWEYLEDRGLFQYFLPLSHVNQSMLDAGKGHFEAFDPGQVEGWVFRGIKTGQVSWVLALRKAETEQAQTALPLAKVITSLEYLNPATGLWTEHGNGQILPLSTMGPGELRIFRYQ